MSHSPNESIALSRGFHVTLTRTNQLFGESAFAKEYIYRLEDYNSASWMQNFVASIAGASASLIVSAPLDVVKTRIQNRNFDNPESGFRIIAKMMKNEGLMSFFKGLTPKVSLQLQYVIIALDTNDCLSTALDDWS